MRTAVVDGVQFVAVPEDEHLGLEADGFLRFGGGEFLRGWVGGGELEDFAGGWAVGWVGAFGDFGFGRGGRRYVWKGGGGAGEDPGVGGGHVCLSEVLLCCCRGCCK